MLLAVIRQKAAGRKAIAVGKPAPERKEAAALAALLQRSAAEVEKHKKAA
jgi:non-homologous end joining protein Ku